MGYLVGNYAPCMAPTGVVDSATFSMVREALPGDRFGKILAAYNEQGSAYVTALTEGFEKGDRDAVAFSCHTLKSSAGLLGAKTLSDACFAMEKEVRAGLWPSSADVQRLQRLYESSLRDIAVYLAQ